MGAFLVLKAGLLLPSFLLSLNMLSDCNVGDVTFLLEVGVALPHASVSFFLPMTAQSLSFIEILDRRGILVPFPEFQ